MTPQPIKIRADVEMTCFAYDGIEHIKKAMLAAQVGVGPLSPRRLGRPGGAAGQQPG